MEFTSGNSGHSRDQVVTVASQDGVHRIRRRVTAVVAAIFVLWLDWAWAGMPLPLFLATLAAAAVVLVCAAVPRRRR